MGSIRVSRRFRVLRRDGFRCRYCGRKAPDVILEVDHVIPRSRGGTDYEGNLVTACWGCNRGKSALPVDTSFLGWLRLQGDREDWVGDLAEDDTRTPLVEPKTYRQLARQLRAAGAHDDALQAAWHAWREWLRGTPTRATASIPCPMPAPGVCAWGRGGVLHVG